MLRDYQPRLDYYAAKQRQAVVRADMKALKDEVTRTLRPIIGDATNEATEAWNETRRRRLGDDAPQDDPRVWTTIQQSLDLLFTDYEAQGHRAMGAGVVVDHVESAVLSALSAAQPEYDDAEAGVRWLLQWEQVCDALQRWKADSIGAEGTREFLHTILPGLLAALESSWRAAAAATEADAKKIVNRAIRAVGVATSTGPPVYDFRSTDAEYGATLSRFAAQA